MYGHVRLALPLLLGSALLLAGCAGPAPQSDDDGAAISIVASTNVYGDIAETIGGEFVDVTSIVTSSAQDPHSYEASAHDRLAISHADVVIANGGGYDAFMEALLEGAGHDEQLALDAFELAGLAPASEDDEHAEDEADHAHADGVNEHVWYSLDAMDALARELAQALGQLDAAHAAAFDANYGAFAADLAEVRVHAERLHEDWHGTHIAITEPVPVYLLALLGFDNVAPPEFSEAIEEGSDVPPLVLHEALQVISSGDVAFLAYNEQTTSPETEELLAAAAAAGVPVVSFTETLPEGAHYVSWMADNIATIELAMT